MLHEMCKNWPENGGPRQTGTEAEVDSADLRHAAIAATDLDLLCRSPGIRNSRSADHSLGDGPRQFAIRVNLPIDTIYHNLLHKNHNLSQTVSPKIWWTKTCCSDVANDFGSVCPPGSWVDPAHIHRKHRCLKMSGTAKVWGESGYFDPLHFVLQPRIELCILLNIMTGLFNQHLAPLGRWGQKDQQRREIRGLSKTWYRVWKPQAVGLWHVYVIGLPTHKNWSYILTLQLQPHWSWAKHFWGDGPGWWFHDLWSGS